MESLRHLSKRLNSFWHPRRLELKADYVVEVSVRTIIFMYKILEDVDDLYKWQVFRRTSLHHCRISHVDNNITIMVIFIGAALKVARWITFLGNNISVYQ